MSGKWFVDTSVFVYLFDADRPEKQQRSRDLLKAEASRIVISTQVLTEFYVASTRKLARPLSASEARTAVAELCAFDVVALDVALVRRGVERVRQDRLSLWDALIVEAALESGCERLLTEDLQDGRVFDGRLWVANPFAAIPETA
jgi:predicted nucleic acid-binding protein